MGAFLLHALLLVCSIIFCATHSEGADQKAPLDLERLRTELSLVRGTGKTQGGWPREIRSPLKTYDFKSDTFRQEGRTLLVQKKPLRLIPHSVGVAEILWAICPRERLVAFNELSADPESSFIAAEVRQRGPIFRSKETELVLGYRPDLVFTVSYSSPDFKEKLRQARIPTFDLGYFGTIDSIKEQIALIGTVIGEEGNAAALVSLIDRKMRELKTKLPRKGPPVRVLYYDEGGYVPGATSNFDSICRMIGAVNVGTEQGIKSWSQVDYETVLKWNPDVVVVPARSKLRDILMSSRVLAHARAIRSGAVYYVPGVYLRASSQYMLLSADYLAGVIYRPPR
ncbi:ABC transporter substrate-binding protein [Geomonas sp. RF6]|uniref:ABC transporter substrate-binding protein n=1 Tax=Geomonas sp. RF6 TaxID=2897342 RepID=UPI001E490B64|nr:ABC transporter substrate-binding protein [Geomonas sp. RF6]UFS70945.1 ABC transporter substrate-binding protein [Geomonas sp. RF6]